MSDDHENEDRGVEDIGEDREDADEDEEDTDEDEDLKNYQAKRDKIYVFQSVLLSVKTTVRII